MTTPKRSRRLREDAAKLAELRSRWAPRWHMWRSEGGSWCAARAGAGAPRTGQSVRELGQTLIQETPEALEAALEAAQTGPRPELEPQLNDAFVAGSGCAVEER